MPQPAGRQFVAGLVLAAGGSSRLGRPKQLLPYGDGTLLEHVLMLGDQPGVTAASVCNLVRGSGQAPIAVCRYDDGRGHPFAFSPEVFGELAELHGDKAVWKLLDRRPELVTEVRMAGPVPLDVDTWEDYEAVLSAASLASATQER
jgi:CTP:molybdopterin cytidylyltransferase MocA